MIDDFILNLRPLTHNQDLFYLVCKEARDKTAAVMWRLFYHHFNIHEINNTVLLDEFNRRYIAFLNTQSNDGGSLGGDGH